MRLVILCQKALPRGILRNDRKFHFCLETSTLNSFQLAMILVYYDYNPKSSKRLASGPSFGEKAKLLLLLRIGKEALELPSAIPIIAIFV